MRFLVRCSDSGLTLERRCGVCGVFLLFGTNLEMKFAERGREVSIFFNSHQEIHILIFRKRFILVKVVMDLEPTL